MREQTTQFVAGYTPIGSLQRSLQRLVSLAKLGLGPLGSQSALQVSMGDAL